MFTDHRTGTPIVAPPAGALVHWKYASLAGEYQRVTNLNELQWVEPAHYFPLPNGRYQVKVGLSRLGKDFGNGRVDRHAFQFDYQWPRYRQAKLSARAESLKKYYATDAHLSPRARCALVFCVCARNTPNSSNGTATTMKPIRSIAGSLVKSLSWIPVCN